MKNIFDSLFSDKVALFEFQEDYCDFKKGQIFLIDKVGTTAFLYEYDKKTQDLTSPETDVILFGAFLRFKNNIEYKNLFIRVYVDEIFIIPESCTATIESSFTVTPEGIIPKT